jgi:CBS domain containing-hemolysin-like protein
MSNAPSLENDLPPEEARPDEEASWFERLLQTFGLGEEPDLRELIEDALARSKSDTLSTQERSMLRRILQFGTLTVEDVMVPRADIIAVDDTVSVAELMDVFRQAEHSRVPVYHETLDDPRGMVHIRDLMSWITSEAKADQEGTLNLAKVDLARSIASINILREILYVPGSMSVLDLLLKMQTTRLHLALVVDEYGGTDGLVSIEDLVEEVVGDIADEHDVEDEPLIKSDPRLAHADLRSREVSRTRACFRRAGGGGRHARRSRLRDRRTHSGARRARAASERHRVRGARRRPASDQEAPHPPTARNRD